MTPIAVETMQLDFVQNQPTPAEAELAPRPPHRKRRRGKTAYDTPTDEKRAWGRRLAEAREDAGLSQTEAAHRLGYSQPVQLLLMESGQRMPPLDVLIACTQLYGTTMDFLCGLAPDSDRDPALGIQRQLAAGLSAELRRVVEAMSSASVNVARAIGPNAARLRRLASLVLQAQGQLERVRSVAPTFDEEVRGGSLLVQALREAADAAKAEMAALERRERQVRRRGLGSVLAAVGGLNLDWYLHWLPPEPGSLDDVGEEDDDEEPSVGDGAARQMPDG
ncbi:MULTISPECIES: helix-turn-helix domain-containing protein [unclassified Rubrivivax]|uniref:helix-turn-helix domain-containing protein n=1 Tax=unclassified Rubrivivax TaxID=2649762 RepID=UPI001E48B0EF|nr:MULTISPECIES: helix-turn-helix transcriptional regulator [unclassified Rubrivivax]MCC9595889.1 helix-turn-helix domain-containing protein [Rubrivivax sp. JA1055]MCC9647770.1 helix-turn-helix domain-containing protein [Rubrivivax sp. JA1029]